jgi:putative endonuclease
LRGELKGLSPNRSEGEGCRAETPRVKAGLTPDSSLDKPIAAEVSMTYVYILKSLQEPEHYYIGLTRDLRARLRQQNAGDVSHTSKYAPWIIKTYIAFTDEKQAFAFERYLKSASGRAFAKKRL